MDDNGQTRFPGHSYRIDPVESDPSRPSGSWITDGHWQETTDGTMYNRRLYWPCPVAALVPNGGFTSTEHIVRADGKAATWLKDTFQRLIYVHRVDCFYPCIVPGPSPEDDEFGLSAPVDLEAIISILTSGNPGVIGITCIEGGVLWCAGTDGARAIMKERANAQ